MPKNTVCLWFDKDAEAAARFYAEIFADSKVIAVRRAPSDYPSGKEGDVLTVEFTVAGIPCIGLNGGPIFKHNRRKRRSRECLRLVQGQMGHFLADHASGVDRGSGGRWQRGQACV